MHILTEEELRNKFLNKIDKRKYHVCTAIRFVKIENNEYIFDWDLMVHKMYRDKNGFISTKYWSDDNKAIIDSRVMEEGQIYEKLATLIKECEDSKIKPKRRDNKVIEWLKKLV